MTGTSSSSSRPNKLSKKNQEELLSTRYDILKENHENLVKDYSSLEERFNHATEINEIMKFHFDNQTKELEAENGRLVKDCERERNEKEEYKKIVEERKTMIDDLMIKNQELMNAKDKREEELKEMKNKYHKLTQKVAETVLDSSKLKPLYDDKNLIGQRGRNNVAFNNSDVTDAIVIREDNSSKVIHLSSSSSSDDDGGHVIVQLPIKKFRR